MNQININIRIKMHKLILHDNLGPKKGDKVVEFWRSENKGRTEQLNEEKGKRCMGERDKRVSFLHFFV